MASHRASGRRPTPSGSPRTRTGCRGSSCWRRARMSGWASCRGSTSGELRTLDAVPDEELDRLASWGVTGLWLIGLWERSRASATIKRLARRQRGGRLGLLPRRLPDRRRPGRRGGLAEPGRSGLESRHPARLRHGPQPHGHRFTLGHRASGAIPVAAPAALPVLHLRGCRPVVRRAGRDPDRGPLLERHRRGGRVPAGRRARPAMSATSTTATTAPRPPGTTRPSSTTRGPRSAKP